MTDELDFRQVPLAELAARIRTREVSACEVVAHALSRIAALDPTLHAFTSVDADRALAEAAAIDARLAHGEEVGSLAGIPIGVKDLEDAAGFVTTYGSLAHAGDLPSVRDSVQVERLRAAGCVVVGKTSAPEYGLRGETHNFVTGITRNPWALDHTPGGSSGGSSAAIASGMVPLATGSDGGGSIRIPSAVTGLTGLKPSFGRVPIGDPDPPGWQHLSARGPMANRAADVATALDVVVGPHPFDHRSLPAPPAPWAAALDDRRLPVRVAWSPTLGYATVDREVLSLCEAAMDRLAAAGTEVVLVDQVFASDPTVALGVLVQAYTRRTVEPFRDTEWWDKLDPLVIVSAEMSAATASAIDVVKAEDACHHANRALATVLADVDVLCCPTARGVAARCENLLTVDEALAFFAGGDAMSVMNDMGIDFDVMTRLLETVKRLEPVNIPVGRVNDAFVPDWHGMTQAFNMTRSPAGTVCAGLTTDGIPVGLQVVGRQHDDVGVLRTLAVLEDVLNPQPLSN